MVVCTFATPLSDTLIWHTCIWHTYILHTYLTQLHGYLTPRFDTSIWHTHHDPSDTPIGLHKGTPIWYTYPTDLFSTKQSDIPIWQTLSDTPIWYSHLTHHIWHSYTAIWPHDLINPSDTPIWDIYTWNTYLTDLFLTHLSDMFYLTRRVDKPYLTQLFLTPHLTDRYRTHLSKRPFSNPIHVHHDFTNLSDTQHLTHSIWHTLISHPYMTQPSVKTGWPTCLTHLSYTTYLTQNIWHLDLT